MRTGPALALAFGLARAAAAQEHAPLAHAPMELSPAAHSDWAFSGSVLVTDPPGSQARTLGILYAQRGPLHLETRYNYEDLDTLALFGGWTFSGGEALAWEVTPMLGLVGGRTDGIAPGLELDLTWRRFAFYTESEHLFDAHDAADDYFYSWSTLTYDVSDWLAAGAVGERSKLVDSDFEVQIGLALELAFERLELGLYSYNLGTNDAYTVVSFGGSL